MNPSELLRIIDTIHREKKIEKEIVFQAIEAALVSAGKKHYGEDEEWVIRIDRADGSISGTHNGEPLDESEALGRIVAQTAKQVIIEKVRDAERDALFDEYEKEKNQLVTGVVQRYEGGAATVALQNCEAILPRSEQIPGETHHANERVRATVFEVKKAGSRVKVILSRTHPALVGRLFEYEIPEIADGVIQIKAMAREPGYRTKVAVSSTDQRVDCVGACVGVRGNRIKNIVDELAGERIDIVRWSDDMQVLIPNALQPAEAEEVILCSMLGRAIVLVREDQLSLAIGRRGQNVQLASKLCGWDIEIMTREELDEQINRALTGFNSLDGVDDNLSEKLVGEGFLSCDDLSIIEPDALMEMGGLSLEQVGKIVTQAEAKAEAAEAVASEERRRQRKQERIDASPAATEENEPVAATAQQEASAPHEAFVLSTTADLIRTSATMRWLLVNGIVFVGFMVGRAVAGNLGSIAGGVLTFAGYLAASDAFVSNRKLDGFWFRHRGAFVSFLSVIVGVIVGVHFYNGFLGILGGLVAGSYVGDWLATRLGWAGETLQTDMTYRIAHLAVVYSAANAGGKVSEREQAEILAVARRLFVDLGYGNDADATNMVSSALSMLPDLDIPSFVASLAADWQRRLQYDILRTVFSKRSVPNIQQDWLTSFFHSPGLHDRSLLAYFDRTFAIPRDQRNTWLSELGVPPHASPEDITAAYRKAATCYHPDTMNDLPPQMLALAQAKMVALNAAYSGLLSDGTTSDLYFRDKVGDRFIPPDSSDFSCLCWLCDKTNRLPKVAVRHSARCGDCHALLGLSN